eukprot:scaffold2438_cov429-Pavlova_lutheri.AAC.1
MFPVGSDARGGTVCRMLALLELGLEVVGGGSTEGGRQTDAPLRILGHCILHSVGLHCLAIQQRIFG